MGRSSMNYDNEILPNTGYDFTPKKYRFQAVCISERCNELRIDGLVRTRSVKPVKKTTVDCPDCGHILVWEKEEMKEQA